MTSSNNTSTSSNKQSPRAKLMRRITKRFHQGMADYELIEDGDKILIGLSGGKDSLALVQLLGSRAKIHKPKFTVVALHVVMTNVPYQVDADYLRDFCASHSVQLEVREGCFDPSTDMRKSPCFLCSWNRRKILFETAQELGCNKIALGHHMDDILVTLLMNITFQGAFSTMPPKLVMRKMPLTVIRPMCLVAEKDLVELAELEGYRKLKKDCPYETHSHRSDMERILKQLEAMNAEARYSLWKSMTNIQTELLPEDLDKK